MRKSNEQLKLYKELYDPDKDLLNENRPNMLLSVASERDKEKIKEVFNMYEKMDPDDVKKQIENLKSK
jgi:hypothetical protein